MSYKYFRPYAYNSVSIRKKRAKHSWSLASTRRSILATPSRESACRAQPERRAGFPARTAARDASSARSGFWSQRPRQDLNSLWLRKLEIWANPDVCASDVRHKRKLWLTISVLWVAILWCRLEKWGHRGPEDTHFFRLTCAWQIHLWLIYWQNESQITKPTLFIPSLP